MLAHPSHRNRAILDATLLASPIAPSASAPIPTVCPHIPPASALLAGAYRRDWHAVTPVRSRGADYKRQRRSPGLSTGVLAAAQ